MSKDSGKSAHSPEFRMGKSPDVWYSTRAHSISTTFTFLLLCFFKKSVFLNVQNPAISDGYKGKASQTDIELGRLLLEILVRAT